jgi:hypothetical protein
MMPLSYDRTRRLGLRRLAGIAFLALAASCSEPVATDPRTPGDVESAEPPASSAADENTVPAESDTASVQPEATLSEHILRLSPTAPPLEQESVSFWARRDQAREAELVFQGHGSGRELARLRIGAGSLRARPDGTPFGPRDSVLVTLRLGGAGRILVELEPHGLAFDPLAPAELTLYYREADLDFDADGALDPDDGALEERLSVWHQVRPGDSYDRKLTRKQKEIRQVVTDLQGFSRYAIAY